MEETITIVEAELNNTIHAEHILRLLSQYAKGITGGGQDLSDEVKQNLIPALRKRSGVLIIIAYHKNIPAGLAISFEGFSTFYAKPLINIHDFVVEEQFRGKGIARLMLDKIEQIARDRGCCKLTLEVLEGNIRAHKVYKAFGFAGYTLDEAMGKALFWDKNWYNESCVS